MVLIAGCLGSKWCRNALRMSHLQGTVNLISRDVVESLTLVSFRKTLPVNLCRLEQDVYKRQELHIIADHDTYLTAIGIESLDMATATQSPALLRCV